MLSRLDVNRSRGIEIGPLANPMVTKGESEVYYVDHADQQALQAKYLHDPNVDVQSIVPVDALWGERTLRESFPDARPFDYVIASHVIEHVPDMLGWLREIAEVLRPAGHLVLAVPDKRFTFDYLRQPSRPSEIIDAYLRRIRRPSPAQVFDYNANAAQVDLTAAWQNRLEPASLKHYLSPRCAFDLSVESVRNGKYIDGHCWVFTARSFAALLADLVDLDLLPYSCVEFHEPERNSNEFIVLLERWAEESSASKQNARASFMGHVQRFDEAKRKQLEANRELLTERAALQKQIQALEAQRAALLSSRSFRITRPLRTFASLMRRLRLRSRTMP
jgi:SAM-dependent methyltransferase